MTKVHVFDIPEDDTLLPAWLEAQIAGAHLGDLVAELDVLQAVNGNGTTGTTTLDAALGGRLNEICEEGLDGVPPTTLRRLFRQPELLVELQDRVLVDGGPYWDQKLEESEELSEMADAGWSRLASELGIADTDSPVIPFSQAKSTKSTTAQAPARPARWFLAGVMSAAAALTLAAFIVRDRFIPKENQVAQGGWGWNKPGAFPEGVSRSEYLKSLAETAQEWRKKRPETREALAQRISEFREGCSKLILSKHEPLPPADRQWLIGKCQAWAKKLDEHLADAEGDKKSVEAVRGEVDQTVDKLMKALRDRANQPTTA